MKCLAAIIVVVITIVSIIILVVIVGFVKVGIFDGCGIAAGPYYGVEVKVGTDSIRIDEFVEIPDGRLAISNKTPQHSKNKGLPPIFMRLDKNNEVVWAISLGLEQKDVGIPLLEMRGLSLKNDKDGYRIELFNVTLPRARGNLLNR